MTNLETILCHSETSLRKEGANKINQLRNNILDMLESPNFQNKTVDETLQCVGNYFNYWLIFVTTIENRKTQFMTKGIFQSVWKSTIHSKKEYSQSCWRFETVMIGLLYASILFNKAVREKEVQGEKKKDWMDPLLKSYSILRNICLCNITSWTLRKETELPFECTLEGCKCLIGMCLVELQHYAIHYVENELNFCTKFKLNYWIYKKIDEIKSQLKCRIKDQTIQGHSWSEISDMYKLEAVAHMYFLYAQHIKDVEQEIVSDLIIQSHYITEVSLEIIKTCKKKLLSKTTTFPFINSANSGDINNDDIFFQRITSFESQVSNFLSDLTSSIDSQCLSTVKERSKVLPDVRNLITKDWFEVLYYKKIRKVQEPHYDYYVPENQQSQRLFYDELFYD